MMKALQQVGVGARIQALLCQKPKPEFSAMTAVCPGAANTPRLLPGLPHVLKRGSRFSNTRWGLHVSSEAPLAQGHISKSQSGVGRR